MVKRVLDFGYEENFMIRNSRKKAYKKTKVRRSVIVCVSLWLKNGEEVS